MSFVELFRFGQGVPLPSRASQFAPLLHAQINFSVSPRQVSILAGCVCRHHCILSVLSPLALGQ